MIVHLKIWANTKFSKALMKEIVIQGQNKHHCKNQNKYPSRELCEYYYLCLHKKKKFRISHSLFSRVNSIVFHHARFKTNSYIL